MPEVVELQPETVEVRERLTPEVVEVGGVPGPAGPAGPPGPGGGSGVHRHVQVTPAAVWSVSHGFGARPGGVQSFDSSGDQVIGDVVHLNDDTLEIRFSAPFGGEGYVS